jgi:hypothetical protein
LITDGEETCPNGAPQPKETVAAAQALVAQGVRTYVIGFGKTGATGVSIPELNNLACAGETAANDAGAFPAPCKREDAGYVALQTTKPVFVNAIDETTLVNALESIKTQVCCGCPK